MALSTCFANIPTNEPQPRGLLRRAIEAWRCSASLAPDVAKWRTSVPRLVDRRFILGKTHTFSHSAHNSGVRLRLDRVSRARWREMFRFTDFGSIRSWRVAD